jgi:hypothetical protein
MVVSIPVLWFNGLPLVMPAAIGSMPVAMLVVLGLLCAAAAGLLCDRGNAPRRRRLHLVRRRRWFPQGSSRYAR